MRGRRYVATVATGRANRRIRSTFHCVARPSQLLSMTLGRRGALRNMWGIKLTNTRTHLAVICEDGCDAEGWRRSAEDDDSC